MCVRAAEGYEVARAFQTCVCWPRLAATTMSGSGMRAMDRWVADGSLTHVIRGTPALRGVPCSRTSMGAASRLNPTLLMCWCRRSLWLLLSVLLNALDAAAALALLLLHGRAPARANACAQPLLLQA